MAAQPERRDRLVWKASLQASPSEKQPDRKRGISIMAV
jgi:hypothetical protein